ncbi:hypothetical protein CHS0354_041279 [Potamilus streckersoni]|uniref:Peptidase M12B domain-containing protein n=1 Tax=Potamilus streckersoni TaxID=2493646 RepID=A0AAE0VTN3_9BIVA|nr:hypothetical protein CHS0354_041279 [Potamilus streckersoni]
MRLILLFLVVSLAASMPFKKTDDTMEVKVREIRVDNEGLRTKRRATMPKKKIFEIDLNNETVTLDLTLNELVNDNAPMYVSENGELKKWERKNTDEQYAFYQDKNTMASIMVRCNGELCKPIGTFSVKGKKYSLDLKGKPIESTSLVSPIADPPNIKVSMEGDMVILKTDPSKHVVQNQIQVFTQFPSQSGQEGSRKIRSIPAGADIVEIMVYTDEVICSRFIDLNTGDKNAGLEATRFYYALLINEMDTVYQPFHRHPSNTAGLDIRLFFSGIVVSCGSTTATWSSDRHDPVTDITTFRKWQFSQKKIYSLKYDIAMGISGKIKDYILGIAYRGFICDSQYGTNVIYETLNSTWLMITSAHELGHNLGSSHDNSTDCPMGYIMNPYAPNGNVSTAKTQYQFSNCSVRDIQRTLTSLGSTRCTLNHNFNDTAYDEYRAGAIGGDVLSLDYQCQVYYGSGSSACRTNSSTMCYSGVYCLTATGCKGRMHLVKERTQCDTNKWCVKGQCVKKTTSGKNCFVYKTCVRQKFLPVGDGCCQGSVTTNCCKIKWYQSSCYVKVPCA